METRNPDKNDLLKNGITLNDSFDFRLDEIIYQINKRKPGIVGLQLPEGLKRQALKIADEIEQKTEATAVISGNPCFGACDIDMDLLSGSDLMFHFGHAEIDRFDKVIFIEVRSNISLLPVLQMALDVLKGKRICILTTVQHVDKLDEAAGFLNSHGKECVTVKGSSRTKYPGQILGCNFSAASAECDEYLYIGSGAFHPIGAAIATGKKVITADPATNTVGIVDPEKMLRQRFGMIARCHDAKLFGIIVSTKPGQRRMGLAIKLKEKAGRQNKKAFLISMDLVTPEQMIQFKADAFVSTACPRIAIDDAGRFKVPILTPIEFEIVLGDKKWEEMTMDEIG